MEAGRAGAVELLVAALIGDVERARMLLPPCGNPAEDGSGAATGGVTPLMAAAAGGHEQMVELLLRCGADPARRDPRGGSTPWWTRRRRSGERAPARPVAS